MILTYSDYANKPKQLLALTGHTKEEFEMLLDTFQSSWIWWTLTYCINKIGRARPYRKKQSPILQTTEDKLFFILVYIKLYPIQELQGILFGMEQSCANKWIHILSVVLQKALGYAHVLPARKPITSIIAMKEMNPSLDFIQDGTERRVNRPVHNQEEKYSGKKKCHTIKNGLVVTKEKKVLFLSDTVIGKMHDKKVADQMDIHYPQGSTLLQDTAYIGFEPLGIKIVMPMKKPKGGELTSTQKSQNRVVSSIRIIAEHTINGVKRVRILKDIYRNHKDTYDDLVMEIGCGLHNFRIQNRGT